MLLVKKTIQLEYFNNWLVENYTNYVGYSVLENEYELHFTVEPTGVEQGNISSFYDALGANEGARVDLKVEEHMDYSDDDEVKRTDYTLLGLIKASPEYYKGRKVSSSYYSDLEQTDLVVKKIFEDVPGTGQIEMLKITHQWFTVDNTVGISKIDYVPFNKSEVKSFLRARRTRQIDFLVANSEGTPIEGIISAIYSHYANQIEAYEEIGSPDFETAVNAETDPTVLGYLDTVLGLAFGPTEDWTVRDAVIYQIVPSFDSTTKQSYYNS